MGCTEGTSPATLTQRWRLVPGGADEHEGQKELGRGGRGGFGRFPATAIAAGGAGGGSVLSQRARPRMTQGGWGALTFPGPRGSGSAAQRPLRPRSLLVHARSVLKDTTETVTASASGTSQPHRPAARTRRVPTTCRRPKQSGYVSQSQSHQSVAPAAVTLELRTPRLSRGRLSKVPLRDC